mmetsp:Transcript_9143/g.26001  ORF Transcript_9143/g.26001 Transcript_9143/m.26001 type:complete len:530 (+) Transcript_9143:264-1853(+)
MPRVGVHVAEQALELPARHVAADGLGPKHVRGVGVVAHALGPGELPGRGLHAAHRRVPPGDVDPGGPRGARQGAAASGLAPPVEALAHPEGLEGAHGGEAGVLQSLRARRVRGVAAPAARRELGGRQDVVHLEHAVLHVAVLKVPLVVVVAAAAASRPLLVRLPEAVPPVDRGVENGLLLGQDAEPLQLALLLVEAGHGARHHGPDLREVQARAGAHLEQGRRDLQQPEGLDPEHGQLPVQHGDVGLVVQLLDVLQLALGEGHAGLGPVQPLKVHRLQGLREAEAVVDGDEVDRGEGKRLGPPSAEVRNRRPGLHDLVLLAHQDVPRVPVRVEQPDVQDADPVDRVHGEHGSPDVRGVVLVLHELLDGHQLGALPGLALVVVEDPVGHPRQGGARHLRKVLVVQEVRRRLPQAGLPDPHRGLEPRVAEPPSHEALGVVRRQGLLVRRLHHRDLLPSVALEHVAPAEAVREALGLHAALEPPGDLLHHAPELGPRLVLAERLDGGPDPHRRRGRAPRPRQRARAAVAPVL